MSNYVDCHLHLQDPRLTPHVDAVLARARAVSVGRFVCCGTCAADWPHVAALARNNADVAPTFGLHPWFIANRSADWLTTLEERLRAAPSAVGEIGLDRWVEPRDEADQEDVFRAQLELARRLNRPAVIHCVRAWDWLMHVLRDASPPTVGFHLHAYGGPVELMEKLAAMGAYFSFSAALLGPRNTRVRQALTAAPADRLLTETDCPDFAPPPAARASDLRDDQGHALSEPANLPTMTREMARLRGVDEGELAAQLVENADRLYGSLWKE